MWIFFFFGFWKKQSWKIDDCCNGNSPNNRVISCIIVPFPSAPPIRGDTSQLPANVYACDWWRGWDDTVRQHQLFRPFTNTHCLEIIFPRHSCVFLGANALHCRVLFNVPAILNSFIPFQHIVTLYKARKCQEGWTGRSSHFLNVAKQVFYVL